ncbi:hypothetical protein GCM10009547_23630 [Sporichthya brevicatena]|uniref:Uncharacterized protein n=1 Tax=Sporichthya brevicatena TaxID=171442 RepID=A0ABN1GUU8_9ACTN
MAFPDSRPRRRSRLLVPVGWLALAVFLGLLGWSAWFRMAYGSFPGEDIGDRITWCGHDFRASVTDLTGQEANDDPANPLVPAFKYPPVWPQSTVHAAMRTAEELAADPTLPCAPELYVRTGSDRYTRYLPAD